MFFEVANPPVPTHKLKYLYTSPAFSSETRVDFPLSCSAMAVVLPAVFFASKAHINNAGGILCEIKLYRFSI